MPTPRHVSRPGRPVYGRPGPAPRRGSSSSGPRIRLSARLIKWVGIATLGLALLALVSSATTLKTVTITGNRTLAADRLQRLTATALEHQWFGRNTLLINTGAVGRFVQTAEPGVKTIRVSRHLPGELRIAVTERQPSLNWRSGGQLYLLDADGTVLGASKGQYVKLPAVNDSANLPVKEGSRVVPSQFVAFASAIATQLPPASKLQIAQMSVPQTTSELYVTTDRGLLIKFDTTRPAGGEISDLVKVLQQLQALHKTPSQYIDLRVEHKAYYK